MLHEMVHLLLIPITVTLNACISACEKSVQWEESLELLQEMVHQLLSPNAVSFSASITSCEKGKQWQGGSHAPAAWKLLCGRLAAPE